MPVERISKAFKDISATFQISPLNHDLISITNEGRYCVFSIDNFNTLQMKNNKKNYQKYQKSTPIGVKKF